MQAFKVVRWIREAQEIWDTAYGMYVAIPDGVFAVQMGEGAAQLLGALLGIDGITEVRFNPASGTSRRARHGGVPPEDR